jgi:hypothetical protein
MKQSWGKPGNFTILGAFSLVLILSFFAFMLDLGQIYWVKNRNQNAAEAAALAAIRKLNLTPAGLVAACNEAVAMVTANSRVDGEFSFVANCGTPLASTNEIKFGIWNENNRTFTTSTEPIAINAIKVNVARLARKNNAVSPLLANIMGMFGTEVPTYFDVSASAIVVNPDKPASEANIFPVAASDCGFLKNSDLACGREVVLGDAPGTTPATNCPNNPLDCEIDSTGNHFNWTAGTNDHAGTGTFYEMANALVNCLLGNSCNPTHLKIGDSIYLAGGDKAGTFNNSGSLLDGYLATHPTLDVQIPVFHSSSCSVSSSPTSVVVVGFGTFRINKIVSSGSKKYIRGTIQCGVNIGQPGSTTAVDFGTDGTTHSSLVQ